MHIKTQVEFSHRSSGNEDRTFYLPSDEEIRAYHALQAGREREAQSLLDDAIVHDPSRGPRIYDTLARAGASIAHVYWNFCGARLEHSPLLARRALDEVRERRSASGVHASSLWLQQTLERLRGPHKQKSL